jgi:hypothetical protein
MRHITDRATDTRPGGTARAAPQAVRPGFLLLFSTGLREPFQGFAAAPPGVEALPADRARAYLAQLTPMEAQFFGRAYVAARRTHRWPFGWITLPDPFTDGHTLTADVYLLTHVSGAALWEVWLPLPAQPFDAARWNAWLDPDAEDGLAARLWQHLGPVTEAIGGGPVYDTYFPVSVLRTPTSALDAVLAAHAEDIVRLAWLDRASRRLKPAVVREALARDYCARAGGLTLLSRRGGLDLHDHEDLTAPEAARAGVPPRSAFPFLLSLELLLIERTVLQRLYTRLAQAMPTSIDQLLRLKQQILDALEEYYGVITAANRFSDDVAADGEQLLGITDLYEAVIDRLDTVSFAITTRYQQRTTVLQFWLTVVFGATEIGFIASGIATWYYHTALGAVLTWTIGTALASGLLLVALLRGRIEES